MMKPGDLLYNPQYSGDLYLVVGSDQYKDERDHTLVRLTGKEPVVCNTNSHPSNFDWHTIEGAKRAGFVVVGELRLYTDDIRKLIETK